MPVERRGRGDLEADPVGEAGVGGALAGGVDRALVGVEADDGRRRVGLGEQQRRRAVAAADVGDVRAGGELGLDAVEGRDPGAGQVVEVAGPEEPFAAAEHVLVVGAPGEPVAGAEPLGDRVGGVHRADGDLERADHAGRAGLVGERDGVLVGQREPAVAVVGDVAAGRLRAQPLAHVPLGRAGARRPARPAVSGPAPAIAR